MKRLENKVAIITGGAGSIGISTAKLFFAEGAKVVLVDMSSSVAGILGSPNVSAYITSKHAVVGIMRATAVEAAPRKIRVNSVHPSPVDNRMMRSLEEGFSKGHGADVKKTLEATIPLGRYAEPIEIAQLVLFLASDDSQFITGTTQIVDGGLCVQ